MASDEAVTILPNRRSKKPHRKTRGGCFNCKKRKVKCDESRPTCASCAHFGLPCGYAGDESSSAATCTPVDSAQGVQFSTVTRRGRGRPRKIWVVEQAPQASAPPAPAPPIPLAPAAPVTPTASTQSTTSEPDLEVNLSQAELLHQFTIDTGPGLAGSDDAADPIARFWARNVPRLGLSHPAVLHLCLSLAAYHLHYLAVNQVESQDLPSHYLAKAEHHFSLGLSRSNHALSTISPSTSGAVYVSTVLVCYCAFAAGPTCPEDLLVCNVGSTSPNRWLPLARGARLVRQLYDTDVLFSGLVEPLGPKGDSYEDPRPMCVIEDFIRLDWVGPVESLRKLVTANQAEDHDACRNAFNSIANIYEATFGDNNGLVKCPGHNKMVLVWLYMMDDAFIACVQRLDPIALLLLGYYAPLIKTLRRCWYLETWPGHLLSRLETLITGKEKSLLEWPTEAVELIEKQRSPHC